MRFKCLFTFFFLLSPLFGEEKAHLDLVEIYLASPIIYLLLIALSLFSFMIWCYSLLTLKTSNLMPPDFLREARLALLEKKYDQVEKSCKKANHPFGAILGSGLSCRKHGHHIIVETMQSEGKRWGIDLWQRLSLLNDVAIISPMLGLLGTVLGLFYAFYDMNRSDALASLFDGLGIAVGTTVAGLIVALFSMIFYTSLKFRIVRILNQLENEAHAFSAMIEQT